MLATIVNYSNEVFCVGNCNMLLRQNFEVDFLFFFLQICRVEDLLVNGIMKGSIIHIHRARTVIVDTDGMITASELGH